MFLQVSAHYDRFIVYLFFLAGYASEGEDFLYWNFGVLALLENENSDVADNDILFAEVPRTAENA